MDEKAKVALNRYSDLYCLIYKQEAYQGEAHYSDELSVCLVWCELPFGISIPFKPSPRGNKKGKENRLDER